MGDFRSDEFSMGGESHGIDEDAEIMPHPIRAHAGFRTETYGS